MAEKRPYPGDHGAANGVKRARPSDALAAARAAAEAKAREIAAKRNAATTPSTPAPAPAAAPTAAPSSSSARLEALKARMAGLKSNDASKAQPGNDGPSATPTLDNQHASEPPKVDAKAPVQEKVQSPEDKAANPYFDPKSAGSSRDRMGRNLLFNQRGKYLDQASKLRAQQRLEQIKKKLAQEARRAGLDENSERGFIVQQPPEIEWWDEGILPEKSYDCLDDPSKVKVDEDDSIITIYVQHPPFLKAPQDQRLITIKPMYLTTKEQAKLRRQKRNAKLKDEQAKIRLGLEPPPPPKVKRGNMMRVMGEQAIADPTAVEMLVESQIKDRHDAHVNANEERKLSKEDRHAKLQDNQTKDAQKALYMCVFRINTLAFGKHRYQIDISAKQHALTGVTIFNPNMNLVIVEGGHYAIDKYKKLMLNRIKWVENAPPTEIQAEKQASDPSWLKSFDAQGNLKDHSFNKCVLVFEGEIKQRAFRKWGSKMCVSDGEAREFLGKTKLDSLWALAKSQE